MCVSLPRLLLFVSLLGLAGSVFAEFEFRNQGDDGAPWVEDESALPAFPHEANLREFYVSETTSHHFFIDASTLGVGQDGVVRYVLVLRTSGGALNVTYEGIRCATREYRIYASGHRNGSWARARLNLWRPIENKPVNRHHAALSQDLFCPDGVPIRSPDEGREALRLGKHPEVSRGGLQ